MKSFFVELFNYSHYFNKKLIEVFLNEEDINTEKANALFSHVLNAHHIWNHRITGEDVLVKPWDSQLSSAYEKLENENFNKSMLIIDNHDLRSEVFYQTMKGESFTSMIRDMLFQIVNHSTYHRGQIATEFRNAGLEPLLADYIFYK